MHSVTPLLARPPWFVSSHRASGPSPDHCADSAHTRTVVLRNRLVGTARAEKANGRGVSCELLRGGVRVRDARSANVERGALARRMIGGGG